MAKFSGNIGFIKPEQKEPGIVTNNILIRHYTGDIIKHSHRYTTDANKINDDVKITTSISLVSDRYMIKNHYAIKFVELYGVLWNVESISIEHPRIILSLGDVYNGPR